jgi:hypothetical protein
MIIKLIGDDWLPEDNLVISAQDDEKPQLMMAKLQKKLGVKRIEDFKIYVADGRKCNYKRPVERGMMWKEAGVGHLTTIYFTKKPPPAESTAGPNALQHDEPAALEAVDSIGLPLGPFSTRPPPPPQRTTQAPPPTPYKAPPSPSAVSVKPLASTSDPIALIGPAPAPPPPRLFGVKLPAPIPRDVAAPSFEEVEAADVVQPALSAYPGAAQPLDEQATLRYIPSAVIVSEPPRASLTDLLESTSSIMGHGPQASFDLKSPPTAPSEPTVSAAAAFLKSTSSIMGATPQASFDLKSPPTPPPPTPPSEPTVSAAAADQQSKTFIPLTRPPSSQLKQEPIVLGVPSTLHPSFSSAQPQESATMKTQPPAARIAEHPIVAASCPEDNGASHFGSTPFATVPVPRDAKEEAARSAVLSPQPSLVLQQSAQFSPAPHQGILSPSMAASSLIPARSDNFSRQSDVSAQFLGGERFPGASSSEGLLLERIRELEMDVARLRQTSTVGAFGDVGDEHVRALAESQVDILGRFAQRKRTAAASVVSLYEFAHAQVSSAKQRAMMASNIEITTRSPAKKPLYKYK